MPCYSCSTEFGFLRKEIGCEICGFSFCPRCCKKREVPSKQGDIVKQLVCNKCFDNLNSKDAKATKMSPPSAYKKRMEGLRSFSVDSGSDLPSYSAVWACEKDKEIAERLQRLKKDRVKADVPSEDDIAERLAILKGIEPSKYKAPPVEVYRRPDMRTAVEQATDLMKQVALEAELDSRLVKPEDEIAARLAHLRDEEVPEKAKSPEIEKTFLSSIEAEKPSENMDIDQVNVQWQKQHASVSETASKDVQSLVDDPEYKKLMMDIQKEKGSGEEKCEDEEEEANKLVEKLLATNIDEEELDSLNDDTEESNSKSEKDTVEEFPWCVICTEDAKIRCFDCDSDIYCLRCFKECHDTFEIKDHKTCPYLPGKNTAL